MKQTVLITGSTDGIGLETARVLLEQKHQVLLHGRSPKKLKQVIDELSPLGEVESFIADLSEISEVKKLANEVSNKVKKLDVLINNAGVLKSPTNITKNGLDIRFAVNTFAPYLLTKLLLPMLKHGRVVNLSSAAQSPINLEALANGNIKLNAMDAYSQSKLAITMWSFAMAESLGDEGPIIIAVNPGSLLGTKMVKEGFGTQGKDLLIGANILVQASVSDQFAEASGQYFDNDSGRFTNPHSDALNHGKRMALINALESTLSKLENEI